MNIHEKQTDQSATTRPSLHNQKTIGGNGSSAHGVNRIDAKEVKELLRAHIGELAPYLYPNGKRAGNHWCAGDVTGSPGKSFKICLNGDKAGLWGDFADSQKHSRSLLDLWMQARGVDFGTALHEAGRWLGIPAPAQREKPDKGAIRDGTPKQPATTEAKTAPTVQPRQLGEILAAVTGILRRYVVFSLQEQSTVIATWIVHTWLFEAFDYTAYLFVFSASKRSGKSRVLEVIEQLARKPIKTEGANAAALIRSVSESDPPTMLLDELDALYSKKNDTEAENTRRFLNAGYRRGAKFLRCVGQGADITVKEFPAFCPKALAGIDRCLPDTVLDRSIPIELVRQSREQKAERFREREVKAAVADLRAELGALAQQAGLIDLLRSARPALPEALNDRVQDITEPLIAITDLAGGVWPGRLREALVKLCAGEEDADRGVKLLAAIKAIFDATTEDKQTTKQLLDGLVAIEDGPWALMFEDALKHDRLSSAASRLARLLKPYKIKTHTIRVSEAETGRGYYRADFVKEWERYLSAPTPLSEKGNTPNTGNTYEGKNVLPSANVLPSTTQGSTDVYEGKNGNVLSVIPVLAYSEGGAEKADGYLAALVDELKAEARDGLFPKGHPDCPWGYTESDSEDGPYYPDEYTGACDYLSNGNHCGKKTFGHLSRLVFKIAVVAKRGTPLCSNYREWREGSYPQVFLNARAYVEEQRARLEQIALAA